jgi:hypothetical protein
MDSMQERIAVLTSHLGPVATTAVSKDSYPRPDQEYGLIVTFCSRMDSKNEVIDGDCGCVRSSCFQFATDPGP